MPKFTYYFQAEIGVTVEAADADAALARAEQLRPADRVLSAGGSEEVFLAVFESAPELFDPED